MCGLAGYASSDPAAPGDGALARAGSAALAHRGPDGEGWVALPGCALAHRRLAIVDLSERGAQPMANEDASLRIVFNGEIYNHVELRRDLEPRHPFRSASDTEVILHLYEERGPEAIGALRGMFAFALWDAGKRRLLLARDRLGVKPLHYRETRDGIAFASEIPALLAMGAPREFDKTILGTYLALGYVPAPETAFAGIRRLEAGSLLLYEGGRSSVRRYWSPPIPEAASAAGRPRPGTVAEAAREILPILEESVRIRLRSDVPVGVFLSGGLDSSIVAALAARLAPRPLRTFTVVFDESGYDESGVARATAAAIGSDHSEIRVEARAAEALPALIRRLGDPLADSSLIAVHRLSEAVRREVKVALSGDGGDEVFLGYDRYRAHRLAERWRRLPALARRTAAASVAALPGVRGRRNLAGRAGRFLAAAGADPFAANDRWLCRFHPDDLDGVLTPEARALIPADPLRPLHDLYTAVPGLAPLDVVARADLGLWLPEDVLRKVDGASMACALEVRSPLLDQEVVENAASIPAAVRMPGSRGKEILRACARGLVPRSVLSGRKAGFGLPVDRWLRSGPLRDLAFDALTPPSARSRAYILPDLPRRLLEEHQAGRANHDEALFSLLVLEIFLRDVVGGR
jgi:asparagine synthase (glutamine-hydrolysing)